MRYEFSAEVWRYDGPAAWWFVTLPRDLAAGVRAMRGAPSAWGTVRVQAATGQTRWSTSLFPDSKSGSFLLPVKADVRRREQIAAGEARRFVIELEQ